MARAALVMLVASLVAAPARAAAPLDVTLGGAWSEPLGPLGAVCAGAPAFWLAAGARADSARALGLRLDGGFTSLKAGDELALGTPSGGSPSSWATLTQRLAWLTVGPELGFHVGRARVHAHATLGAGEVRANASVRGEGPTGTHYPAAFEDPPGRLTMAWTAGGGVRVPLGGGVGLDLGGAMVGFGRAPLLVVPLLVPGEFGRETFAVADLPASLAQVRVGLSYTPRPSRPEPYGPPAPHAAKPPRVRPLGPPRPAAADSTSGTRTP
jgi:hypothetical protein